MNLGTQLSKMSIKISSIFRQLPEAEKSPGNSYINIYLVDYLYIFLHTGHIQYNVVYSSNSIENVDHTIENVYYTFDKKCSNMQNYNELISTIAD